MNETRNITLDRGWIIILRDVGIDPRAVLRLAKLPLELLSRESTQLSVREYFAMLRAVEHLAQDPLLPLRLGTAASPESFSPPIFAALCSPSLAIAVQRISEHKRLIAPMCLSHTQAEQGLTVAWEWHDSTVRSPRLLMAMELVFMTQIARIATREHIQPLEVTCPIPLEPTAAFADYFGVTPLVTRQVSLTFSMADAHRPFLTASEALWKSFAPELQRRASSLDVQALMSVRTRSVLLECLPSGDASLRGTARRLGVSTRTLQRRLASEGVSFREVVQGVREQLADHYLRNTSLSYGEVAFLIGFDQPTSFFRAFREWTGQTPQSVRLAVS